MRLNRTLLFAFLVAIFVSLSIAVDRSKFRTCADTGFCRKYRNKESFDQFRFDKATLSNANGKLTGKVTSSDAVLNIQIETYTSGSIRVKISEDQPRWQPLDLLMSKGLIPSTLESLRPNDPLLPSSLKFLDPDSYIAMLAEQTRDRMLDGLGAAPSVVVVHFSPLRVDLYLGDVLQTSLNGQQMMHFERSQSLISEERAQLESAEAQLEHESQDRHGGKEVVDYGEDGLAIYADGSKEEKKVSHDQQDQANPQSWAESFGGHKDEMPLGPRSVGIDISFPSPSTPSSHSSPSSSLPHLYGLPQHTSPLSLPNTKGPNARYSDPYRLYNLDVFEYEIDTPMSLYGHIPFLMAQSTLHRPVGQGEGVDSLPLSTGVFWFNPSETFVDLSESPLSPSPPSLSSSSPSPSRLSHFLSESGEIDLFLLPGPSPSSLHAQMAAITGTQSLPPLFSLGYHQCRWNYRDERDVSQVEGGFEALDWPMDVIWLDIEHTEGKRYFTWDKGVFPTPLDMQRNISSHGRRMVTIVDPHIKRDNHYPVHSEATALGLYIKNRGGKTDFDGWCWPGSSSYLDFTSPRVRDWWADRFSLQAYTGSTMDLYTWNDMNEPSVFNGPEVSMPKDAVNLHGVEHREWHNLYGTYMQMATSQGLRNREDPPVDPTTPLPVLASPSASLTGRPIRTRPFVLSRAFWAGTQRFGAIWTGDNTAEWSHLKIAAPMLLSISMAGLSFAGSDVGGFFGEPGAELFTRWYQAGAFTPFFRGHAHHDTKRREPWVFGEPYTSICRAAAMLRYSLLPYWYSTFYQAYSQGQPAMRAMVGEFPSDPRTHAMDDQWMVGGALLVKPVTTAGQTSQTVYLPPVSERERVYRRGEQPLSVSSKQLWYEFSSLSLVPVPPSGEITVQTPLSSLPLFLRGGHILPRKLRLRRSSKLMFFDPYTLTIAPDDSGTASGILYLDDEYSTAHEDAGIFALRAFSFSGGELRCGAGAVTHPSGPFASPESIPLSGPLAQPPIRNTVERVIIAGQSRAPSRVSLTSTDPTGALLTRDLTFSFNEATGVVTVKKPDVPVLSDWSLTLH